MAFRQLGKICKIPCNITGLKLSCCAASIGNNYWFEAELLWGTPISSPATDDVVLQVGLYSCLITKVTGHASKPAFN